MFKNLKVTIKDLAYSAVVMAEDTLTSADGKEKKAAAVEYVVSMLPVSSIFKSVVVVILNKFIDEAVEQAVEYMKSVQNEGV